MKLVPSLVAFVMFLLPTASSFPFHAVVTKQQHKRSNTQCRMGPDEAWAAYNTALQTDPLVTKSITASVILGAADLAGQALEKKSKSTTTTTTEGIDWARSARFAFFGFVLQAPWNHFYYQWLDGLIPPTEDPFTVTNLQKVVIDQAVQAPIFTILIFAFLGALEGKQWESIQQQLQKDYKNTMVANCTYRAVVCKEFCLFAERMLSLTLCSIN